jgi:F-type H+-transporting ATPase subunit delta
MSSEAADIVRALLDLSKTHGGEALLRQVRDALNAELGGDTLDVTLMSPSGHEPDLVKAVHDMLKKKYNRDVRITEQKNPSLIGGAILRIGDEEIDLSVRGALSTLELQMRSGAAA